MRREGGLGQTIATVGYHLTLLSEYSIPRAATTLRRNLCHRLPVLLGLDTAQLVAQPSKTGCVHSHDLGHLRGQLLAFPRINDGAKALQPPPPLILVQLELRGAPLKIPPVIQQLRHHDRASGIHSQIDFACPVILFRAGDLHCEQLGCGHCHEALPLPRLGYLTQGDHIHCLGDSLRGQGGQQLFSFARRLHHDRQGATAGETEFKESVLGAVHTEDVQPMVLEEFLRISNFGVVHAPQGVTGGIKDDPVHLVHREGALEDHRQPIPPLCGLQGNRRALLPLATIGGGGHHADRDVAGTPLAELVLGAREQVDGDGAIPLLHILVPPLDVGEEAKGEVRFVDDHVVGAVPVAHNVVRDSDHLAAPLELILVRPARDLNLDVAELEQRELASKIVGHCTAPLRDGEFPTRLGAGFPVHAVGPGLQHQIGGLSLAAGMHPYGGTSPLNGRHFLKCEVCLLHYIRGGSCAGGGPVPVNPKLRVDVFVELLAIQRGQ
eukprot:Sspe_Gene.55561::Locus_30550_Transcript_1_2_Confidence_0.750_Length_2126::g.55561::m.55561